MKELLTAQFDILCQYFSNPNAQIRCDALFNMQESIQHVITGQFPLFHCSSFGVSFLNVPRQLIEARRPRESREDSETPPAKRPTGEYFPLLAVFSVGKLAWIATVVSG
jgi:hypothetical protein